MRAFREVIAISRQGTLFCFCCGVSIANHVNIGCSASPPPKIVDVYCMLIVYILYVYCAYMVCTWCVYRAPLSVVIVAIVVRMTVVWPAGAMSALVYTSADAWLVGGAVGPRACSLQLAPTEAPKRMLCCFTLSQKASSVQSRRSSRDLPSRRHVVQAAQTPSDAGGAVSLC